MFFKRKPKPQYLKLGDHSLSTPTYDTTLNKEALSRRFLEGRSGRFLEIGAGDEELRYLLGVTSNLDFDDAFYAGNRTRFDERFQYFGMDLSPRKGIAGDICSLDMPERLPELQGSFDVVYSNNVFEHLRRPWIAARNILWLMKPGAICITIAPFAVRYHAVPDDYFRYTHTGLIALFEDAGPVRALASGYDLLGRRNDWQGGGEHDDIVPIDEFGAWRETWFAVCVIEKA